MFKLISIIILLHTSSLLASKLIIDVYIESECPYSKKFVQEQVKPDYEQIKDDVSLQFIPFGKSHSVRNDSSISFVCQHGSFECESNLFQSCGLSLIGSDMDRQTNFIICAMDYKVSRVKCAGDAGLQMKEVTECMESGVGTHLQLDAEKLTAPIIGQSTHVPTIVFNGEFNSADDDEANTDFLSAVKRKLKNF